MSCAKPRMQIPLRVLLVSSLVGAFVWITVVSAVARLGLWRVVEVVGLGLLATGFLALVRSAFTRARTADHTDVDRLVERRRITEQRIARRDA